MTCEYCEAAAKWRFHRGSYERFSCSEHIAMVRRLVQLDLALPATYQFEPCCAASVDPPKETT